MDTIEGDRSYGGYGCQFFNEDRMCVPPDGGIVVRCSNPKGYQYTSCPVYKLNMARLRGGSEGARQELEKMFGGRFTRV